MKPNREEVFFEVALEKPASERAAFLFNSPRAEGR
jgi:hypothetical protein